MFDAAVLDVNLEGQKSYPVADALALAVVLAPALLARVLVTAHTTGRRLDAVLAEHAVARPATLLRRRRGERRRHLPRLGLLRRFTRAARNCQQRHERDRRRRGNASPRHGSRITSRPSFFWEGSPFPGI